MLIFLRYFRKSVRFFHVIRWVPRASDVSCFGHLTSTSHSSLLRIEWLYRRALLMNELNKLQEVLST